MDDIYLLLNGKEEGPFTMDDILQAVAWGFIPDHVPAWHEGLAEWIPVGKLIPLLEAGRSFPSQANPNDQQFTVSL